MAPIAGLPLQYSVFFCFLGPKPRVPNFAEIHASGGRGLQRPTFRDLIPPLGAQPLRAGPRRHSAVPGRAVAGAHGAVPGAGRGGLGRRSPGALAEPGQRHGRGRARAHAGGAGPGGGAGVLGAETGPCGRSGAAGGRFPGPGRRAACGPNAAKSGRGPGRGGRRPKGAVPGCGAGRGGGALGRGGGPGARRHSTLSVAACVGSGEHPVRAAARRAGKALFRYIRKRSGRRAFLCQIRAVLTR